MSADGVDIESETLCDQFGDTIFPDHTLVFDEISARQITIKISDKKSIISLDEVEIIGVEGKNGPDPAAEQITGDVNGDNEVDSSDATLILKYDAGSADLTDVQKDAADVNRDGEADSLDATYVLKFDSGIIGTEDFFDMQIKRDFADAQNEPGRAGDVEIKEKYGPYNGAYAMFINFNDWCFLTAITEETVAGVTFRYASSQTLSVYADGAFMTLKEANDSGVLSNDEVAALASEYYEKHPNFAQE